MVTTKLPTNSEYEKAVQELKKLNEDIFYGDFKEKMNLLESNNKELLENAVTVIDTASNEIASFTRDLAVSAENNRNFLKQNEAYVALTKGELAKTEEKLAAHVTALRQMEDRLERLQKSYKEMFHKHSESINTILVVREEALINKVIYQLQNSTHKHLEQLESYKSEIELLQEKVVSMSKHHNELFHILSNQTASKEDLKKIEKKNTQKMNILLAVAVVEAILIGIKFFI
jgi:DNA anti-recombination protein RmuC